MEHSEYVAFILPMDWLNRRITKPAGIKLYKSFKLPVTNYSGVKLKCCFNIYIRGNEKKKEVHGVTFYEYERGASTEQEKKDYLTIKADYRVVVFGGVRVLEETEPLKCNELKIVFDKKRNFKPVLDAFYKTKRENTISKATVRKNQLRELIYDTYPDLRAN